jgi:hypothetical protein
MAEAYHAFGLDIDLVNQPPVKERTVRAVAVD